MVEGPLYYDNKDGALPLAVSFKHDMFKMIDHYVGSDGMTFLPQP